MSRSKLCLTGPEISDKKTLLQIVSQIVVQKKIKIQYESKEAQLDLSKYKKENNTKSNTDTNTDANTVALTFSNTDSDINTDTNTVTTFFITKHPLSLLRPRQQPPAVKNNWFKNSKIGRFWFFCVPRWNKFKQRFAQRYENDINSNNNNNDMININHNSNNNNLNSNNNNNSNNNMRSNNSYKTTMASLMPPWLFHRVTSLRLDEQWVFSIPCLRWPLTDEYHRLSLDWIGNFPSTLLGLLQSWCYSRVLERGYSSSYRLLYLHLEVSASHSKTPFSHRVRGRGFVFHEQQKIKLYRPHQPISRQILNFRTPKLFLAWKIFFVQRDQPKI